MADLTARLLDPETFGQATEACLSNLYQAHLCIGFFAEAVAELHARLRTAKADLDRKDRTIIALEELRRQTEYVHSEQIKEKEILAYDTGKELEAALIALATAKAEGAAKELDKLAQDIDKETQDEDFFRGVLTTADVREHAAAIRKGLAKEGK